MASLACATVLSPMDVVRVVTAAAVARRGRHPHRFTMAVATEEPHVGAVERESGSCLVVEVPELPAVRVVTVVALRSEASAMHIHGCMTRRTVERGVLECLRDVAFLACDERVRSDQGQPCEIVIEEYVTVPAALVMALLAGRSLLALVDVVRLVTCLAARIEPALAVLFSMAVVTRDLLMLAAQRILRVPIVVESSHRPPRRHVTALALRPKSATMNVVPRVTSVAAPGR